MHGIANRPQQTGVATRTGIYVKTEVSLTWSKWTTIKQTTNCQKTLTHAVSIYKPICPIVTYKVYKLVTFKTFLDLENFLMENVIRYFSLLISQVLGINGQNKTLRQVCVNISPVTTHLMTTKKEERMIRMKGKTNLLEEKIDHILRLEECRCV